jgi:hypothetical protein
LDWQLHATESQGITESKERQKNKGLGTNSMSDGKTNFNDKVRRLWGYRILLKYKTVYQSFKKWPEQKKLVFILGCQRSGTTLMARIFNRDLQSKVYTAFSNLSSRDPDRLRLDPLPMVAKRFEKERAALVVAKPIVESQNAVELLDFFEDAKVIWMFRNPKDVVRSNIKRFGNKNGLKDISPIIRKESGNWRSEKVTHQTRKFIYSHFSVDMQAEDAAALFWYSRNQLFFDQNLQDHPRVKLCLYDDLVTRPDITMRKLYRFIDQTYPGNRLVSEVNPYSVNKGQDIGLTSDILQRCETSFEQLLGVYKKQEFPN